MKMYTHNILGCVCVKKRTKLTSLYRGENIFLSSPLYSASFFRRRLSFFMYSREGFILEERRWHGVAHIELYKNLFVFKENARTVLAGSSQHQTPLRNHTSTRWILVCSRYALIRHVVYGRRMPPKHIYSPLRRVIKISGGVSIRALRENLDF